MSAPIGMSDFSPNLPMVKAMAAPAPSGAVNRMSRITPKSILLTLSNRPTSGFLYWSFRCASAKPIRMAMRSTWRMSPSVKALNIVFGIIFSRCSFSVRCCAFST